MILSGKSISLVFILVFFIFFAGSVFATTIKIYPSDDTWVDIDAPTKNYGTNNILHTRYTANQRWSYLKFDLSSIPSGATITSAKIYMYVTGGDNNAENLGTYFVSDDTWVQGTCDGVTGACGGGITWDTKPAVGSLLSTTSVGAKNNYYNWDVTSQVNTENSGDDKLSVAFYFTTIDSHKDFCSKENTDALCHPYIEITYTVCGNEIVEGSEQCDGGACCNADCTFKLSSTVCRGTAGICDVAEQCTGSSATCPADSFLPSSTVCNAATGDCDVADYCTGTSASCSPDAVQPDTFVCRASGGVCDISDKCDGSTKACPADTKSTAQCRASAGICDLAEVCDGLNNDCPADIFKSNTEVCRPSEGVCDPEEKCTGTTATCPADAKSTSVCRPSAGDCDIAESCDGLNNDCQADLFKSQGTSCDDGLFCNDGETCNGAGACTGGSARSCSANNIFGIATCDNNPDLISFTWDSRNPFTSICNEATDICTIGSETITHTCNKATCGAQCETNDDCNDGNAQTIDTCNLTSCGCEHVAPKAVPTMSPILMISLLASLVTIGAKKIKV